MKTRYVKLAALVLAVVFVFGVTLAGCGSSSTDNTAASSSGSAAAASSAAPAATADQNANAGKMETVHVFSSIGAYKALLEQKVAEYNNSTGKQAGINIDLQTNIDKYAETLTVAMKAGNAPDIFDTDTRVAAFVANGWEKAIDDIKGGPELLAKYKGMLKPVVHQINGKTYTLPYEFLPIKLAYNKDLFKQAKIVDASGNAQPPKTWNELVADAKAITAVGGGKAFGYGFTYAWSAGFQRLICVPYIPTVGHFWFDQSTGKYDFVSFAPMFNHLLQMKKDGSLFPGPESIQIDPIRAQFSQGRIGMITAPAYDVGVYNDQFPAKCDWGVAELPVEDLNATRYKDPSLERALWGISSSVKDDRIDKVFTVYKWLFSDDLLAFFYKNDAMIPYSQKIIDAAGTPAKKVGFADFSANLDKDYGMFPMPDSMVSLEGSSAEQIFEDIYNGKLDATKGLQDLQDRYNAGLDQAVKDGKLNVKDYMSDADLAIK